MTDDLRDALDDLARSVELEPLDPHVMVGRATSRRRQRRSAMAGATAVLALVTPLAWSAVPGTAPDVVLHGGDDAARSVGQPAEQLVSGTFELRYDGRRYDERSDEALTSCDGLSGLRTTGSQLDSLPPIRSFWFAGTASQQDAAARCLRAMPAAIVTFEEDAFFVPVVLREADLQSPGRLVVRTSRLRPSAGGWLEHELVLTNRGTESLVVDPESLAEVMGGSIAVSTGRCSAIATPGAGFACEYFSTTRVLAPGESAVTTVELERDVPGMSGVEPGTHSLSWTHQVTSPEGRALGDARLTLTYEVLSAARGPAPAVDPAVETPGGSQTVQVFFSSTAEGRPEDYCNQAVAVPRQVPLTAAVATAALNELFRGPTEDEERRYRIASAFTPRTADLLRSVRVVDGVAYVDLRSFDQYTDAGTSLGAYSTSCGSVEFHSQVTRTLQQFPTVREVRYAFDGDPRAFVEYMQGGCPDPVPAGDPCDPEPFRR